MLDSLFMPELLIFMVGLMQAWVPTTKADIPRYRAIAEDAISVANEQDWLGLPPDQSAVAILAIASYESGYRRDVDKGKVRGDDGRSVCLGQVQAPAKLLELIAKDRKLCFRVMLTKMRQSWRWCASLPFRERLSGYTVGRCVHSKTSRMYTMRIMEGIDGVMHYADIDFPYDAVGSAFATSSFAD